MTSASREISPKTAVPHGTAIEYINKDLLHENKTGEFLDTASTTAELTTDQENTRRETLITNLRDKPLFKRFLSLFAALLISVTLFECVVLVREEREWFLKPTDVETQGQTAISQYAQPCSPTLIDPTQVTYRSEHAFYTLLQSGLIDFPPPVFQGKAAKSCDGNPDDNRGWEYCLPITGRKDDLFCRSSGRGDLLNPLTHETRCFASVLHMLLVDVYEEMKHQYGYPVLLYSTLLGAVHEGRTMSFAESIDIGYQMQTRSIKKLRHSLTDKGYHMFHQKIWHVCVAPTHPLASNLYDPAMHLTRGEMEAPYVDLYEIKDVNRSTLRIDNRASSPYWPRDRILPFSRVTLQGLEYDTVADPEFFLKREYGNDYMTPKDIV